MGWHAGLPVATSGLCQRPNPTAFWIPSSLTSRVLRCCVAPQGALASSVLQRLPGENGPASSPGIHAFDGHARVSSTEPLRINGRERPAPQSPRWQRVCGGRPTTSAYSSRLRRSPRDGREFVAGGARIPGPGALAHAAVPAMAESLWRHVAASGSYAGTVPQSPRWQRVCGGDSQITSSCKWLRRSPRDGREFVAVLANDLPTHLPLPQSPRWQRVCGGVLAGDLAGGLEAAVPAMAESLWRAAFVVASLVWAAGRSPRDGREFVAAGRSRRGRVRRVAAVPAMAESLWRHLVAG